MKFKNLIIYLLNKEMKKIAKVILKNKILRYKIFKTSLQKIFNKILMILFFNNNIKKSNKETNKVQINEFKIIKVILFNLYKQNHSKNCLILLKN